jgi:dipeptidyl aminopeptidase/acylaminoacyl peptidase
MTRNVAVGPRGVARLVSAPVVLLAVLPLGCNPYGPKMASSPLTPPSFDAASFPQLGPAQPAGPGVVVHRQSVGGHQVWVYLPAKQAAAGSLPCVLIAPAGTPLIYGIDVEDGDSPEHLPYARDGFAVVAYSISGPVADDAPDAQVGAGARAFKDAQAGFNDAERALAFALARVPAIDPKRVYTAGHSSAATLSLLVAENEPRVAACVAYAPCSDVRRRLGGGIGQLEGMVPGFGAFIDQTSPINGASRLRCPLFLFHAQDDNNVPIAESVAFVNEVKKANPNVTFVQAQRGGHHESMIQEGIPKAIQWLKALPAGAGQGS